VPELRNSVLYAPVFNVLILLLFFLTAASKAVAGEIDACKFLVVENFTSDPYGIANELRKQAREQGFTVISSASEVDSSNRLTACVMAGSWSREAYGGNVTVQVVDVVSGSLIGEASASGTAWWSASRTVRGVVKTLYAKLGYKGYSETVLHNRIQRLYPARPKVSITEAQITNSEPHASIEGIWTDPDNKYRLGIVKAPDRSSTDFVAVVLQSESPVWQPGEIKTEIRSTASPDVYTCTYFFENKKPGGATLYLEHDSVLRSTIPTPKGSFDLVLLRVWPKIGVESTKASSVKGGKAGTGFLLTRSGLIVTNWHVVSDAKQIAVIFPGWKETAETQIVLKDVVNDLAILRVSDTAKLVDVCHDLPFQLATAKDVVLGQRVSTVGYPLSTLLGSNPKFSEGVISSRSGIDDDPRWFQISAAIQPGSSGSPLFDQNGNIIGVVVATLDAAKAFQITNSIPQNVNWAIKSDYLLNLVQMIPNESSPSRMTAFSPEKAAACVALISAQ
jgi:S1-C subfamily serine protease